MTWMGMGGKADLESVENPMHAAMMAAMPIIIPIIPNTIRGTRVMPLTANPTMMPKMTTPFYSFHVYIKSTYNNSGRLEMSGYQMMLRLHL